MKKRSYLDVSSDEDEVAVQPLKKQLTEVTETVTQPSWIGGFDEESSSGGGEEEQPHLPATTITTTTTIEINEDTNCCSEHSEENVEKTNTTPSRSVTPVPTVAVSFTKFKCGSVDSYQRAKRISEGGYGVVTKAVHKKTGRLVALKKIKFGAGQGHSSDGVHTSGLREITTLLSLRHTNIITAIEAVFGDTLSEIFLVMEYVEYDVRKLITPKVHGGIGHIFTLPQVKCLMMQLLSAVGYLHDSWILHRDLKTNNMLYGSNGVLKLCDFGMARLSGEPLRSYTPLQFVLTLGFRPPEGLLGSRWYDDTVDMWGVGCAFAEILTCAPLFNPSARTHTPEKDILNQIFTLLGTPPHEEWSDMKLLLSADPFASRTGDFGRANLNIDGYQPPTSTKCRLKESFPTLPPAGLELLSQLLKVNPKKRINATEAFQHGFFKEAPLPTELVEMPRF